MNRNIELKQKHHHHGLKSCINSNSPGGWKIKREVLHQFSNVILGSSHFGCSRWKMWMATRSSIHRYVWFWLCGCKVADRIACMFVQKRKYKICKTTILKYILSKQFREKSDRMASSKMESMSWILLVIELFLYPIALCHLICRYLCVVKTAFFILLLTHHEVGDYEPFKLRKQWPLQLWYPFPHHHNHKRWL